MNIEAQTKINQAGVQHGVQWRVEVATKAQLVRLRRFYAERPDFEKWFDDTEQYGCGDTPARALALIIDPRMIGEIGWGPDPVEMFWEAIGGDRVDVDDPDYLAGFIEGALS